MTEEYKFCQRCLERIDYSKFIGTGAALMALHDNDHIKRTKHLLALGEWAEEYAIPAMRALENSGWEDAVDAENGIIEALNKLSKEEK